MDTAVLENLSVSKQALGALSVSELRYAVKQVIEKWEQPFGPLKRFAVVGVCDTVRDRYLLLQLHHPHGLQVGDTLAYLEIKGGKIHIEADATEEGIGGELVNAGIPKSQIVLAFYPPDIREMGEFAVS